MTFRMGGHSTSDDPTRYVPKETGRGVGEEGPDRCASRSSSSKRKLWTEKTREQIYAEAMAEIDEAAKTRAGDAAARRSRRSSATCTPTLPAHLRTQGQQAFDVAARQGEADAGDGKFPL